MFEPQNILRPQATSRCYQRPGCSNVCTAAEQNPLDPQRNRKRFWLIDAQGLPGCLPWGMLLVFFNDFLAQQKGFSVPAATLVRN